VVDLRIVFFGTPAFAVPSLEALIASRHQVVAVVSQPDRPKGRGHQLQATPTKAVAETHGIPVLQPAKIRVETFLEQIRELKADLGVVVAFGRILPDALLAIPRLGMINVHASVLPRYRGAAPIQRAVIAGDLETGVTIMRVEAELDAGPTFAVATVPIPPDATSGEMERVLAPLGAQLLLPVVDDLAAGRAVETPQDHAQATHAAKITKEEGAIDWTWPADRIHNQVRGLQPWPLAWTRLGPDRLVLRRTLPLSLGARSGNRHSGGQTPALPVSRPDPGERRFADLAPGTAAGTIGRAAGDELIVACGEGTALQILEIQPEGRRNMTVREFLAGRVIAPGARFTP
jgi:methionyl-tRNA formyltransferase